MHISVIGTGYVGLVTGACFAEFGVNVTCMDNDARRVERLERGEVPFFEPGITELVAKGIKEGRLSFTTDVIKAVEKALVIFIAVGTPPKSDGSADLSFVEEVGRGIAAHMTGYKVIVTKSTVPVGTGERLRDVIRKHQPTPINFDIVSNPEFLREGSAIEDFMRPNRVVIGTNSEQAAAIMKDLYRPLYLIETPFVVTDVPTAEMIKYASNAFLAVKISFINEMATVCERVGANVQLVAKGMGLDHRIGGKFLHAGPGFGRRGGDRRQVAAQALQRVGEILDRLVEVALALVHQATIDPRRDFAGLELERRIEVGNRTFVVVLLRIEDDAAVDVRVCLVRRDADRIGIVDDRLIGVAQRVIDQSTLEEQRRARLRDANDFREDAQRFLVVRRRRLDVADRAVGRGAMIVGQRKRDALEATALDRVAANLDLLGGAQTVGRVARLLRRLGSGRCLLRAGLVVLCPRDGCCKAESENAVQNWN